MTKHITITLTEDQAKATKFALGLALGEGGMFYAPFYQRVIVKLEKSLAKS